MTVGAGAAHDSLRFEVLAKANTCRARLGRVSTLHGDFDTPAFMPVGTQGTLKGLLPPLVSATGSQIVLANTYHLLLRPGPETVAALGDLHSFMAWPGPILTDSGGYQAYSMSDIRTMSDEGFTFKSIVDGSDIFLSPEKAMHVQNLLGPDIMMALDDCPPSVDPRTMNQSRQRITAVRKAPENAAKGYDHGRRLDDAVERTSRWLERCKQAHQRPQEQALFGIVQGGADLERRSRSAEQVCNIELPGYAIGGVAVGEGFEDILKVVRHTAPLLPDTKPRYLMGVGYERDILAAVMAGVDMFDCVLPTRNGRSATAFTPTGPVRLRNACHTDDPGPIDPTCDCLACRPAAHGWQTVEGRPFSRGYLRHLFQAREMLGAILVSLHNVRHFQRLMLDIRAAIRQDAWSALGERWPVAAPALSDRA